MAFKEGMMPAKGSIKKENNNEPKTEPCGTPQVKGLEANLLVLTDKILPDK